MRNNQPVTQTERLFGKNEYIVSKTDLKGRLTYVNRPFLEISGFSEDELLGSAHNIVRHPDMPPEAFDDMWRHLQAGKPWQGMVKNRCKNGDFYWVQANANPIWEEGRMVGYMSLRVLPSREQVRAAQEFYASLREGRAQGWTVRHGKPARTGLRGWLSEGARVLQQRAVSLFSAGLLLIALLMLALGGAEQAGYLQIAGLAISALQMVLSVVLMGGLGSLVWTRAASTVAAHRCAAKRDGSRIGGQSDLGRSVHRHAWRKPFAPDAGHHARQPQQHGAGHSRRRRADHDRFAGNRLGLAGAGTGRVGAGRLGRRDLGHAGADGRLHRTKCRERPADQHPCAGRCASGERRRHGGGANGAGHAKHRRADFHHRRHRLPDQYAGAQRRD
ncbi:hypothetical protein THICB3110221 [Thiomonas sp. CB3]|nr:hypothetical protein THICB3110221 [Thiomonas sp. CB3]